MDQSPQTEQAVEELERDFQYLERRMRDILGICETYLYQDRLIGEWRTALLIRDLILNTKLVCPRFSPRNPVHAKGERK